MDKVLKQRLVGAAILIALAVIFVPMLFDGPDESRGLRDSSIDLPAPPADRQEVRRLPLDPGRVNDQRLEEPAELIQEPAPVVSEPEAPVGAEPSVAVTDPAVVEAPPEQPGESGAEEVSERNPEPEIEPEPVRADPEPTSEPPTSTDNSTPPTGAWQVQVASFSSAETAERITNQLKQLGHPAGTDLLVRGETRLHRVWAGPFATRAAADRARAQIVATVAGVEPLVRAVPGPADADAAKPTRSGYAVQVGSFAEQSNADRQLSQLLEQGFDAFVHADQTGSRPIWRVRVGTFSSRDEASELQRELREQAGLEGLIVSHP